LLTCREVVDGRDGIQQSSAEGADFEPGIAAQAENRPLDPFPGTAFEPEEGEDLSLFPLPPPDEQHRGGKDTRAAGANSAGGRRPHSLIGGLDDLLASAERRVLWALRAAVSPIVWPMEKWITLRGEIRSWDEDREGFVEEVDEPALGVAPEKPWIAYWGRPVAGPVTALVALMGVYIGVFGDLTYRQQSNYGTFGFDMGIYDQGIWLISHLKTPFDTIRGINYFGQHVNVISFALVPFYWLGAGPHFLFAFETVWFALGAVPLYLLGRDRLHNSSLPLAICAAYLLYPPLEWTNEWMFHPDSLMATPLMFAYYFATRRRWGLFWVFVIITLSCKEDAGLAILALGIVVWFKFRDRTWGLITALTGAAWFLICTKLIIPLVNGGGQPFYFNLFPEYGSTLPQIAKNLLFHPSRLYHQATGSVAWTYYGGTLWPVALLALFAPSVLFIALPQILINTMCGNGYTRVLTSGAYYNNIVIAAVFLATIETCARRGRSPSAKAFMVGLVLASSVACNVAWSPSPISVKFHNGTWASPSPQDAARTAAIALVPPSGAASATYDIDDHMTHRTLIYEYPNPWITTNWGLNNDDFLPNPNKVDWLVLNTAVIGPSGTALYRDLEVHQFRQIYDQDGVLVLHRIAPGIPNDHNWP
jgi:uncharacterized membrane protein